MTLYELKTFFYLREFFLFEMKDLVSISAHANCVHRRDYYERSSNESIRMTMTTYTSSFFFIRIRIYSAVEVFSKSEYLIVNCFRDFTLVHASFYFSQRNVWVGFLLHSVVLTSIEVVGKII